MIIPFLSVFFLLLLLVLDFVRLVLYDWVCVCFESSEACMHAGGVRANSFISLPPPFEGEGL